MSNLGTNWLRTIAPVRSTETNNEAVLDALNRAEGRARAFFEEMKSGKLRAYLETSATNGNDTLAIEAPSQVLGTEALADFSAWARGEGLNARIVGLIRNETPSEDFALILLVTPLAA